MVFCACGSLMEFGHILRERVLDTMTNLHQQWLAPHRKQSGDKQDKNRCADEWDVGCLMVVAHYLYIILYSAWGLLAKPGLSP